jgi:hypothetical protein
MASVFKNVVWKYGNERVDSNLAFVLNPLDGTCCNNTVLSWFSWWEWMLACETRCCRFLVVADQTKFSLIVVNSLKNDQVDHRFCFHDLLPFLRMRWWEDCSLTASRCLLWNKARNKSNNTLYFSKIITGVFVPSVCVGYFFRVSLLTCQDDIRRC